MEEYIPCFACGAKGLNIPGETHRYMLSSPGCWAMYNEVLEKEYSDFQYANHTTSPWTPTLVSIPESRVLPRLSVQSGFICQVYS